METVFIDARPLSQSKVDPSHSIHETLVRANPKVSWRMLDKASDENGGNIVSIKIVVFESTFSLGNWTGVVKLDVQEHVPGVPAKSFTVERAVTLSNMWGYKSADDALSKAFEQAMSDLVSRL